MNPNAASRKDVRAQEKIAARLAVNDAEVVRGLMSTMVGRAWMHSKLEFCHIFSDPFTNEALLEAYRKGERNIGLALLADIMLHCPQQYILMMEEANARHTAAELTRSTLAERDPFGPSREPADGSELEPEPDAGSYPGLVDYSGTGPKAH